ncbi:MAG: YitT family protein [Deltaproteobacteria bacterium]|nr:YitT family protein [Deltaproteobacteria bacterium]
MDKQSQGTIAKKIKRFLPKRHVLINLILLAAGSSVVAIGINAILVPKQFMAGGGLGVALIIHYLFPHLSVSILYVLVNVPLVVLGWYNISRRFILYTAFGIVALSVATQFIQPAPLEIPNPILAAVLAGIICGVGMGIVFRSAGSSGGVDILAVYLNKKWEFRLGWTFALSNTLILSVAAGVFSLETALYTLIYVFTTGKVIDAILTGFNQRKQILIISDQAPLVAKKILNRLNRGATFLEGHGAHSGQSKQVIFSIVTITELARMKDLIFETDPQAFVVINDTMEVLGRRHGKRRVY